MAINWHISIISRDGRRLVFHAQCADEKEVQALAATARAHRLSVHIWIKPPADEVYSWD